VEGLVFGAVLSGVFSTPLDEVCVELCEGQGREGEDDIEECVRPRKEQCYVGCGRLCLWPPVVDLGRTEFWAIRKNEKYERM
jgi:hypothetical protein